MNQRSIPPGIRERFQWGSYGFVPGLLVGILLGWMFSGVVSWIVRFGVTLLLIIPLVAAFLAWRWWSTRGSASQVIVYEYPPRSRREAIDADGRIVETVDVRGRPVDVNAGYPER